MYDMLPSKEEKGAYNDTYMFPPRSFELSVIVTAPNQTTTKTSANCGPPSFSPSTEPFCSILRNSMKNYIIFYTKLQKHASHQIAKAYCI